MKFIKKQSITLFIALNLIIFTCSSLLSISEKKSLTAQYNSKTSANDWGQGSVFYLDRHNVDCGAHKVIQGFHLFRPHGDQIAYEFGCGGDPSLVKSNTYTTQTPWNETSGNERHSTNYLDRHNVQCRSGFALQQFKLIRNGNRIAYQFRCVQLANAQQCRGDNSPISFGNTIFENIYLDRQRLFVGADRAITSFKLNSQYKGRAVHYTYSYSSCKMGAESAPNKPSVPHRPTPNRPNRPTPNRPNRPTPNRPNRPTPNKPNRPSPNRPNRPTPNKPNRPSPNRPNRPTPNKPNRPTPNKPNRLTPNKPNRPSPNKPNRPSPNKPNRPTPNKPNRPTPNKPSVPHRPNHASAVLKKIPVFNKQTSPSHWGAGSVFNFDKHNVECGNGFLMQGFHLKRPSADMLAYEYACVRNVGTNNPNDSYTANTIWNETAKNNISSTNYLDRHSVACKPGYALQQFRMISNINKIAYNYRCAKAKVSNCQGKVTKESYGHNTYQNIYLDRQTVLTRAGRVLTQFKLNSRYAGGKVFYHYSFTTCQLLPFDANPNKKNSKNNHPAKLHIGRKVINVGKPFKRPHIVHKSKSLPGSRNVVNKNNPFNRRLKRIHHKKESINKNIIKGKPLYGHIENRKEISAPIDLFKRDVKRINYNKDFPIRVLVGKPRKFVPPSLIRPKRLSSGRKQSIQEGNNFCKNFCVPNHESIEKKCWKNGIKPCSSCESKDKDAGANRDDNVLCSRVCNSIGKSDTCAFYSYINEKKKIVNKSLLSKFGLIKFRKYLKRLI